MTTGSPLGDAAAIASVIQIAQQQGWVGKLVDVFAEKHPVLVLGSSGVGKTNFLASLKTLVPQAIDRFNRTEFAETQRIKLGKEIFDFVDTPGQIAHQQRRAEAILDALRTPGLGVINVCCWGYHEYTTGQADAVKDKQPAPDWLERHRQAEINAVREWAHFVGTTPRWFFTVANKCDLWWPHRETVLSHYAEGEYDQLLLRNGVPNRSVFDYSAVRHNFYGEVPSAGPFDDGDKHRTQQALLAALISAVAGI